MKTFFAHLAGLVAILIVDFLWVGIIAKDFYLVRLDHILEGDVSYGVLAIFYLLYIPAIFFLSRCKEESNIKKVVASGAIIGAVAYGTYDLVNWATIESWPVSVVVVDILYGVVSTSVAAFVMAYVTRHYFFSNS